MSQPTNLERDPMWSNREATKINLALNKVGYSHAEVTLWWNSTANRELSNRTPTQAWNDRDFAQVKVLVEKIVSTRLAEGLPENAAILNRLEEARRP